MAERASGATDNAPDYGSGDSSKLAVDCKRFCSLKIECVGGCFPGDRLVALNQWSSNCVSRNPGVPQGLPRGFTGHGISEYKWSKRIHRITPKLLVPSASFCVVRFEAFLVAGVYRTPRVSDRGLNLSRAQTSFHWCGGVVRRGGTSTGVILVT
ncbi:hypothetical protein TNCV_2332871 [Trichonephila clavipes]|nr:hypothetical protein TNCV_2332871 [Trichonephila clavipes]